LSLDGVSIILISIFLLCFLGLIALFIWLLNLNFHNRVSTRVNSFIGSRNDMDAQISQVNVESSYNQPNRFEGVRGKINHALSIFSTNDLRLKISSAYWPISDIEFIFIRILVTLAGLAAGWFISNSIVGGLGLGIFFYLIPGIVLDRAIINRRKKFQDQLLDFLVLIKGAVLAGYSLVQALDMAIKEISAPASEEFSRVIREVRFGFPLDQALINLTGRMQSDDLQIVVTAIILNTQMGGNLSTILEAVIDTIRDRIHLFSEIRSLTSYARYVGLIISLLPFMTALIVFLLNPEYFDTVKTSMVTQFIFIAAFVGIIIGNILIRRVMRIRV
jgi:tight adherence protein B